MPDQMGFFEAYDSTLMPLFTASSTLQLVAGAEAAGLLDGLRSPTSLAALTQLTGVDARTVADVCRALVTVGVVRQDGSSFELAEPWLALTDPGAYVPLGAAIAGNAVEGRALRAASGATYWSMPSEDRLAYARAVSPDPFSDELVASFRRDIESDPDRRAMTAGGRLLELGCGLAGRVLTTLRAAPELTAVGVELSEDLADEARRRAAALGLSDRFEVVCGDAADFEPTELFDFGFWSQFFFPEPTRDGALQTMMRALRPGGVMLAPLGSDAEEAMADPASSDARDFALWRVVLGSWGIPERTAAGLVAEVEAVGFADVRIERREGAGPLLRATRP
ncbi:MAG TPA: class I SAM-dependent methyltransferase [Mycobacteriales bacterium]|nr:class I SAM-dependent methyltransferase [Mycobacteriales bacterium]